MDNQTANYSALKNRRHPSRLIALIAAIYLAVHVSVLPASMYAAHELEDGFIERAVQIVVRDQTASVSYFIGINEATQAELVAKLAPNTPSTDSQLIDSLTEENLKSPQALLHQLAEGLNVMIGETRVTVKPVTIEPAAKHHFTWVARMKFQLAESKSTEITINDENFTQHDGAARYSIKALGTAMILKSNTAPIIIRAKRHLLDSLPELQRKEVCQIKATLAIAGQRQDQN